MSLLVLSSCNDLKKAVTTNSSASSATQKVPVAVRPTLAGDLATSAFHRLAADSAPAVQSIIGVMPYAVASNNDTFSVRIWGWQMFQNGVVATTPNNPWVYVPRLLVEIDCTVGNISGAAIAASTLFCDTLTAAGGDSTARIVSPGTDAADCTGHFLLDVSGSRFIEFDFYKNSGSPTSMNALWWLLS